MYLFHRQSCYFQDCRCIHPLCQHIPGNLKAALVHAFFSAFFSAFLVSVIQEGSFYTYGIPEFVVGTELGICKAGNFQFFY
ncbi:hypothetical protein [Segatella sp.]|uniref:hypothetical protein n=1 Tax=Segatella sp. TaxID=2974253 RepID=UPI003AB921FF